MRDLCVRSQQGHGFGLALRDQHSVKRVAMTKGQGLQVDHVPIRDAKSLEALFGDD